MKIRSWEACFVGVVGLFSSSSSSQSSSSQSSSIPPVLSPAPRGINPEGQGKVIMAEIRPFSVWSTRRDSPGSPVESEEEAEEGALSLRVHSADNWEGEGSFLFARTVDVRGGLSTPNSYTSRRRPRHRTRWVISSSSGRRLHDEEWVIIVGGLIDDR